MKLKTILRGVSFGLILLSSCASFAEFSFEGKMKVIDPYGKAHEKDMPLSYTESSGSNQFQIGPYKYKVPGQPERYSIAIVLQDNNFVWVQEFHDKPIKTFEWTLGEHKISLMKEVLIKPVKGDYILSIDNKDYFFNSRLAQITFEFNEEGIENIDVSGMVASLGLNRAESECKGSTEAEDNDKGEEDKCKPPE